MTNTKHLRYKIEREDDGFVIHEILERIFYPTFSAETEAWTWLERFEADVRQAIKERERR